MNEPVNKQTKGRLFILALVAVFLFGEFGDVAHAGKKKDDKDNGPPPVTGPTLSDLDGKLNMIKESLEVLETNQNMMKTTQETILQKIMELGEGPPVTGGGFPCTQGGTPVGDRWVVSTSGLTVCDKNSGYTWEQRPLSIPRIWQEAIDYCPTLGTGWELPELSVLQTLVDTTSSTCLGTSGSLCLPDGHPFDNVVSAGYWSATSDAGSPTGAWMVNFADGNANFIGKGSLVVRAWCARGGS